MTTVTVRDLSRNTAEVLERVAAGERVRVTLDGELVAIVTAPDPTEVAVPAFVDTVGRAPVPTEQPRRPRNAPRHPEPGNRPLSELIIEMRDAERARSRGGLPRYPDHPRW